MASVESRDAELSSGSNMVLDADESDVNGPTSNAPTDHDGDAEVSTESKPESESDDLDTRTDTSSSRASSPDIRVSPSHLSDPDDLVDEAEVSGQSAGTAATPDQSTQPWTMVMCPNDLQLSLYIY